MPLSLYLHYPFCSNHCSYCDFYKCLIDRDLEQKFYRAAERELEMVVDKLSLSGREIDTIFVGGGTPSLTELELLEGWLEKVKELLVVPNGIEFSIECNPESVTLEKLEQLQWMGVTRPIFGLQSFNLKSLELLGRKHNPHHSQQAAYYANVLGFDSFGVDLIFGLPGQKVADLAGDLNGIFALDPPHISFYQLTVEPDTELHRMVENEQVSLPDTDYNFALYKSGCERMSDHGYQRYEVSSFAKPGHECRHNMVYWSGGEYLALGPSAHSFINGNRYYSVSDLKQYISSVDSGELPYRQDKSSVEDRIIESVMLGLRTSRGIDRAGFTERFGKSLEECINRRDYNLMVESGHLVPDKGYLRLSDEGMFIADEIIRRLLG